MAHKKNNDLQINCFKRERREPNAEIHHIERYVFSCGLQKQYELQIELLQTENLIFIDTFTCDKKKNCRV